MSSEVDQVPAFTRCIDELLAASGVDAQRGLSAAEVATRRERDGWNQLASAPGDPMWKRFLNQFRDVVVWILLVAAVLSGVLGEWTDTAAITAIVLLNAVLGFFQEERAERALAALQSLAAPLTKVLRDGALGTIPTRELVCGDIVVLEAGDSVPADLRLLEAFVLRVQEASLTGESVPVDKLANVELPATTPLADRRNMAYMSTIVANGTARGLVVATGMNTEIGRIAGLLQHYEREPTPLQRQLAKLGQTLVFVCLALVGAIFVISLLRGDKLLDAVLTSVSLAVAAVPEGLPAVVTMALALGLQRMVKRNALIRKLPSVETLGCVTVICSDKTGTLTRNEMTVREVLAGGAAYRVTGAGYTPHGDFVDVNSDQPLNRGGAEDLPHDLRLLLRIGPIAQSVIEHAHQPVLAVHPEQRNAKLQTLLCPVDTSSVSERALRNAIRLAKGFGGKLHVLSVLPEVSWLTAAEQSGQLTHARSAFAGQWIERLNHFLSEIDFEDVPWTQEVRKGRIDDEICAMAHQRHADLIVMGTTGLTHAAPLLMGSTTRRVLERVPCSLLTVKEEDVLSFDYESALEEIRWLLDQAQVAVETRNDELAVRKFDAVLRLNPYHIPALEGRAQACDRLGDFERADRCRHRLSQLQRYPTLT